MQLSPNPTWGAGVVNHSSHLLHFCISYLGINSVTQLRSIRHRHVGPLAGRCGSKKNKTQTQTLHLRAPQGCGAGKGMYLEAPGKQHSVGPVTQSNHAEAEGLGTASWMST